MKRKFIVFTACLFVIVSVRAGKGQKDKTSTSAKNTAAPSSPLPTGSLPAYVRWKADGAAMARVPAGSFSMGGTKNENEKPVHSVKLPLYYIDLTEVTHRQYLYFCNQSGHRPPVTFLYTQPFPEEKMDHPVANVTWADAVAYCGWAGKRLPTEAEWEKACAGPKSLEYPWGNGWSASACTNRINSSDRTSRVGSMPKCKSPYGAYDMAGNVWEWTADWYKSYPGAPFSFDYTGTKRVAKGGAYFYSIFLLRCANRHPLPPDDFSDPGGFRCVVTPGNDFKSRINAAGGE